MTNTIAQEDLAQIMQNPLMQTIVGKAQELDTRISNINEYLVTPIQQQKAQEQYHSQVLEYVKDNTSEALKKAGQNTVDEFLQHLAGGDLYQTIVDAIKNRQAREVLSQRYNDQSWGNAVQRATYPLIEEKAHEYAHETKLESISELSKLKDDEKITYVLQEINRYENAEQFYEQIAKILEQKGFKPQKESLEEKASTSKSPENTQQENTKAPQQPRQETGRLEEALQESVPEQQQTNPMQERKKRTPMNYARYLSGAQEQETGDDGTDYDAQIKELRENIKQGLAQDAAAREQAEQETIEEAA